MSDEAPSTGTMLSDVQPAKDVSMEPVAVSADSKTIPPELSWQGKCGGTWAGTSFLSIDTNKS